MNFKEKIASLKKKVQSGIKPDSAPEELERLNGMVKELEEVEKEHNDTLAENAKFKDAIVRMSLNTGNGDKPEDESGGSKPKTIEECVAEEMQKGGK